MRALKAGPYGRQYSLLRDVVATATRWVDAGTSRLHIVDLDGAFAGEPRNGAIIREVCKAHPDLQVQVGGGIRDEAIAAQYIEAGVQWIIIGTRAVREPAIVAVSYTHLTLPTIYSV